MQLITMASISFERYQALYKPFEKHHVRIRIQISIIASWIVGLVCMVLDWTLFQESPTQLLCASPGPRAVVRNLSYELGIFIFVPLTFLSVCVILVFYGSILYLVQKHVKSTQRTLGSIARKKTNRIAPVRDKEILVNNFMPSDFIPVEKDAKLSGSVEPKETTSSNGSKTKELSLTLLDTYKEQSGKKENHHENVSTHMDASRRRVLTEPAPSVVKTISKDVSFLPPLQKVSLGAITGSTSNVRLRDVGTHQQILAPAPFYTEGDKKQPQKLKSTTSGIFGLESSKDQINKMSDRKIISSAQELTEFYHQNSLPLQNSNQKTENAANRISLLTANGFGNNNQSLINNGQTSRQSRSRKRPTAGSLPLIAQGNKRGSGFLGGQAQASDLSRSFRHLMKSSKEDESRIPASFKSDQDSEKPLSNIVNNVVGTATSGRGERGGGGGGGRGRGGGGGEGGFKSNSHELLKHNMNIKATSSVTQLDPSRQIAKPHSSVDLNKGLNVNQPLESGQALPNVPAQPAGRTDEKTTAKLPKKKDSKKKSKSKKDSASSVVQIHDADGMTVKAKTTRTNITGDICVMNATNKIKGKRKIEAKSAKKTAIVVVTFLIAWLPFPLMIMVLAMYDTQNSTQIEVLLSSYLISLTLSLLAASVNPLVYGAINKQFYKEFKRLIRKCRQRCERK